MTNPELPAEVQAFIQTHDKCTKDGLKLVACVYASKFDLDGDMTSTVVTSIELSQYLTRLLKQNPAVMMLQQLNPEVFKKALAHSITKTTRMMVNELCNDEHTVSEQALCDELKPNNFTSKN